MIAEKLESFCELSLNSFVTNLRKFLGFLKKFSEFPRFPSILRHFWTLFYSLTIFNVFLVASFSRFSLHLRFYQWMTTQMCVICYWSGSKVFALNFIDLDRTTNVSGADSETNKISSFLRILIKKIFKFHKRFSVHLRLNHHLSHVKAKLFHENLKKTFFCATLPFSVIFKVAWSEKVCSKGDKNFEREESFENQNNFIYSLSSFVCVSTN